MRGTSLSFESVEERRVVSAGPRPVMEGVAAELARAAGPDGEERDAKGVRGKRLYLRHPGQPEHLARRRIERHVLEAVLDAGLERRHRDRVDPLDAGERRLEARD